MECLYCIILLYGIPAQLIIYPIVCSGHLKKRSIFGVVEGQLDLHGKVINMAN